MNIFSIGLEIGREEDKGIAEGHGNVGQYQQNQENILVTLFPASCREWLYIYIYMGFFYVGQWLILFVI